MADSLVHNLDANPGVGFELIVVDKLLWEKTAAERMYQLAEAVNGRFSYRHVPPKPSPWQGPWRKTKSRDWYDLNNARNTGIALARGRHVALFDDCSLLGEYWLHWHLRAAERGVCAAGSFQSYNWAKIANGKIIEGELWGNGQGDHRGDALMKAPSGGWMYGLNTSFPLEAALKVNGYDELYSGQGGSEDAQLGLQVELAGYQVVYFPDCKIYQILEHHEAVCEIETWGKPQKTPQKELVLADGIKHFANEWLIQEWFRAPQILSRGNDFNLRELRKKVLSEGYKGFPTGRTLEVDWRDGARLETM